MFSLDNFYIKQEPISLGLFVGSKVVGGLLGAKGKLNEGKANANAAKAQAFSDNQNAQAGADAADFNAAVSVKNSLLSRFNAAEAAKKEKRLGAKAIGENKAAIGASGIRFSGSAMDVVEDNIAQAKLAELTIIYNGELKAESFEQTAILERAKAVNLRQQGKFALEQGGRVAKSSRKAGRIGALSSVLGSAGSIASGFIKNA